RPRTQHSWGGPAGGTGRRGDYNVPMDYTQLGSSGLLVSPVCLGTMMFGDRTDAPTSGRIIDSAREAGINFIDTADVYSKGASEAIVGPAIKAHRREWIL